MTTTWQWGLLSGALGLFVALASLEIVAERARPDPQRMEISGQAAATAEHRQVSAVKPPGEARAPREARGAPWRTHLARVDEALARQDLSGAIRACHDAYRAALGSRRWEALVDVGDAYLRIGEAAGSRKGWEPRARESYLNALLRARQEGSVEGVLRATEAFADLGDREVAEQGLRIADRRTAQDPEARADVRRFRERLAGGARVTTDGDLNQPETRLHELSAP